MLLSMVIKNISNQLNMKQKRLRGEPKRSIGIYLRTSSHHPTPMLCGRAFNTSLSINRNEHLQIMTPPFQIN